MTVLSPFTSDTTQPLELIVAMLRLGRKYDFAKFYSEAIKFLSEELPSSFSRWCERKKSRRIKGYIGVEFDLVAVVRENELYSLLPAALFDCQRYDLVFAFCAHLECCIAELLFLYSQRSSMVSKDNLVWAWQNSPPKMRSFVLSLISRYQGINWISHSVT